MTRTEEETGPDLAALWKAFSKLAATLMWRTGHNVVVPVPHVVEEEAVGEVVVELAVPCGEAVFFWARRVCFDQRRSYSSRKTCS